LSGFGLFAIGSRYWPVGDTFQVSAGFQDVGGVDVGSRVRIQGMDAGEVVAVEPPSVAGGLVIVRLQLAGRFRGLIGDPETARVQIASDGAWSSRFVKIIPGRPTNRPIPDAVALRSQPAPDLNAELAQAAGQLRRVLSEIDATLHGIRQGRGTLGQLVQNDKLYREVLATVTQVNAALEDIRDGRGTLGLLVKSQDAYADMLRTIEGVRQMVASIKQNADAVKSMPIVRSYVVDPHKLLLTQKQSEVVCRHLTSAHKVHKTGWWWWSKRPVKPVGCGAMASPIPEGAQKKFPAARVEVFVFTPQG
jgi:phospholipid/cholesterol/gamma-HCH transport system substrate-binding protein